MCKYNGRFFKNCSWEMFDFQENYSKFVLWPSPWEGYLITFNFIQKRDSLEIKSMH